MINDSSIGGKFWLWGALCVLVWAVGLAAAYYLILLTGTRVTADSQAWTQTLILCGAVVGVIGGGGMGLLLGRVVHPFTWNRTLTLTALWVISLALPPVVLMTDAAPGIPGYLVSGIMGGFATAWVLHSTSTRVKTAHILAITFLWGVGMLLFYAVAAPLIGGGGTFAILWLARGMQETEEDHQ